MKEETQIVLLPEFGTLSFRGYRLKDRLAVFSTVVHSSTPKREISIAPAYDTRQLSFLVNLLVLFTV